MPSFPVVQNLGGTSPAAASTVIGPAMQGLDDFTRLVIHATLQGATGGTLDVYIQSSVGNGWYDVAHFAQLAAAAASVRYVVTLTKALKGTPAIVAVNAANGTPTLAANSVNADILGNAIRVVYVAGALTSAGAVQAIWAHAS